MAAVRLDRPDRNRLGRNRRPGDNPISDPGLPDGKHSQEQRIFLDGFEGDIEFSEKAGGFIELLKAGEFVHIGKGTSSGNGRMVVL